MTNDHGRESRLDRAIDHALQEMMHVEPRPGLRQRVLRRLHDRPARRGWIGAGALATAALLVAVGTTLDRTSELPPASPGQAAVEPSAPSGETSIPPGAQTAKATPLAPTPAPVPEQTTQRKAEPAPESIFGPRSGQVKAASTPGGPQQAQRLRIEIVVTDGSSAGHRQLSLTVTDREVGKASGQERLAIEVRPEVLGDGRIRLAGHVTFPAPGNTANLSEKRFNETVEEGKTLTLPTGAAGEPKLLLTVRRAR